MRATLPLALTVLATTACTSRDDVASISAEAPAGPCSVAAAANRSMTGVAIYSELHARVPGQDSDAPGTRAVTITCLTPGVGGTLVTLMLPGLRAGIPARTGKYHVKRPGDTNRVELTAWAEAELTVSSPARYLAVGGAVHVSSDRDDVIEGSYELALRRAPGTDPRYPEEQVLWGAFRAPVSGGKP
ncbi:MAG TPA: hypothetical protein VFS20_10905 [Longimicrobium sp.]|nr:hypothetical protein [Longimicrobium sp.]